MSLNIGEICKELEEGERRAKINALSQLRAQCDNKDIKADILLANFDETYLYILKCYENRYESVREEAVNTVGLFMERFPPNDFHLLNIITTLAARMGQQETLEESEEIRLIYVKQLHEIFKRYIEFGHMRSLEECYGDIVKILVKAIKDDYPVVQREACAALLIMLKPANTFKIQPHTEPLAKALYTMLNHKHSQSRMIAIEALGRIALHIDASGEALTRLLMEVSPLLMDSMPLVRRSCGELGCLLAYELRDRYSYFERIVPLILCSLKDESPEVVDHIKPLWVKCGKQYYDENEKELSKQELADLPAKNYPEGVARPTIGCRAIVQRSLRLLKLIMREAGDWKENVRLHSLKLLYQFVLHAEAAMTAKFFEIHADLAHCCRDMDVVIAKEALKVADLMGRLFSYKDWCEYGFESLEKNAKEGYLKCFYQMFAAAIGESLDDILKVAELMAQREFSQTLNPSIQEYVGKMMATLLNKCEHHTMVDNEMLEKLHKNMYIATIKVMALSFKEQPELQATCGEILAELAKRRTSTLDDVHELYFAAALEHVENLDAPIDEYSEPIILLYGLINICKFRPAYMEPLQDKINVVWQHCGDSAKLRIFSSISIAMLNWNETMRLDNVEASAELLEKFLNACVEHHLEWRAGGNAQAMRSMAIATLCAASQGAPKEAKLVLPKLHKYMQSLLEDNAVGTRHYAVKCLYNFGELEVEQLRLIAYALLQRLDDPSSGIRSMAAAAIPKLTPKLPVTEAGESHHDIDTWEHFIKKAFELLFLHYGGPETNLNVAIKGALGELCEKYPKIGEECYKRAVATTYTTTVSLKELAAELPTLKAGAE